MANTANGRGKWRRLRIDASTWWTIDDRPEFANPELFPDAPSTTATARKRSPGSGRTTIGGKVQLIFIFSGGVMGHSALRRRRTAVDRAASGDPRRHLKRPRRPHLQGAGAGRGGSSAASRTARACRTPLRKRETIEPFALA
jgi:hypothetical protein